MDWELGMVASHGNTEVVHLSKFAEFFEGFESVELNYDSICEVGLPC